MPPDIKWFYVDNGQQAGPVSEAELETLRASGRITDDTLIWRQSMANWEAYRAAKPSAVAPGDSAPPGATPPVAAAVADQEVVCAECKHIFSKENAIQYGNLWVCANCKPLFVQKLKEGAALPVEYGELHYAGFWVRFVAYILDAIIVGVVTNAVTLVVTLIAGGTNIGPGTPSAGFILLQVAIMLFSLAVNVSYETWFVGKFGATPGKMALRLKVVSPQGAPISYPRACGRYFAKILSGIICAIGYIMAAFDDEKRALHDIICETRVIKT